MNKEIEKAMKGKKEPSKFRKWWKKNDYKVWRVVLFPIWFAVVTKEKISNWRNSRQKWSEERVNKILQYYIPRRSEWDEEDKEFYFFDNGYGWSINSARKFLKKRDRRFWKVNKGFCGGKIREYLIYEFELEGFIKEVGNCSGGWTEIIFKLGVDK